MILTLADPTGSISFVFAYVFAEKCMRRRSAPPNGSALPNGKSWIRHCLTLQAAQAHYTKIMIKVSDGSRISHGGRGLLTQVLFGENVCENDNIWSRRWRARARPTRSANESVPAN